MSYPRGIKRDIFSAELRLQLKPNIWTISTTANKYPKYDLQFDRS
jgi:hypothetical protein